MLRSLFSGISGLRANQTMMDVTGNNIANVNTVGFKSSGTVFQDTLSQTLQSAGAPTPTAGGTNPAQVGLGVRVAGITTNFGQGAAQSTGRSTDLMVQGDGFFIQEVGGQQMYTRGGALSFDATGRLVSPDGGIMQGWVANAAGVVDINQPVADLALPLGATLPAAATTGVLLSGNLPADTTSTTPLQTSIDVYDAQGNQRSLDASFTRTSNTTWSVTLSDGVATTGPTPLTFDATGPNAGANPTPATMTVGGVQVDLSKLTGFAGISSLGVQSQNGAAAGGLEGFSIGPDGTLTGVFTGGRRRSLGQIALATFNNPTGLVKSGGSSYSATPNSGIPQVGVAGSGSRGKLAGGVLEMSNVDLAQEFTNLIIAQRGFQANSRVITASDEILQDLVNLKR